MGRRQPERGGGQDGFRRRRLLPVLARQDVLVVGPMDGEGPNFHPRPAQAGDLPADESVGQSGVGVDHVTNPHGQAAPLPPPARERRRPDAPPASYLTWPGSSGSSQWG